MLKSPGALSYYEMESCLAALSAKGALAYRKLFDARAGHTAFKHHELAASVGCIDKYCRCERLGPPAVVVGEDRGLAHEPLLQILRHTLKRAIGMFADLSEAHEWLLAQPAGIDDG